MDVQQHCSWLNHKALRHTPSFRSFIQSAAMSIRPAKAPGRMREPGKERKGKRKKKGKEVKAGASGKGEEQKNRERERDKFLTTLPGLLPDKDVSGDLTIILRNILTEYEPKRTL